MSVKEQETYYQVKDQWSIIMAKGIVCVGPHNINTDAGLRAMYLAYKAKGEVRNKQVWFYIDSEELGKELSRPRILRILCEDAVKLRSLNPKAYKFFLLDKYPKYINIEWEELYIKEKTVILKGGLNVQLERLYKERKKKRSGVE